VSLIFFDTMLFIYWFEEHPQYTERVHTVFSKMEERGDALCASALTIGEIMTGLYKKNQDETARRVRDLFRPPFVRVLPFNAEAAERYARIRTDLGVSPADAIQLACAAEGGADLFLTNDRRLVGKRVPGIQFVANLDVDLF
jgi:predicted nucleic acid-binding protein